LRITIAKAGPMVQRTAIILSPYFPPSTVAGVHRARHLAKHLPAAGWRPIVLCVDEAHHEERLDPGLAKLVPYGLDIVKVGALPAQLTRPLGVGEISLRAWGPLRRGLFRLLETRTVAAVLITGSPYFPMLFARDIKWRFGIPVVLDFQDPWVSAWGVEQPRVSKARLAHRIATVLEPRALRAADFVTSVSDTQNVEMLARYPWLDGARMAALPIGGDPDDFAALQSTNQPDGAVELEPGFIHLSYVGTFLPRAGPVLRAFFRGFARLRSAEPALAARMRLNFVGTSNRPAAVLDRPVSVIAEAEGVADAVREIPSRVQYLTALSVLSRSDGVLLIGSDEPHYTASKIYPALMSGRPFLSLFHRASSAHAILAAAGGGCALSFEDRGELDALAGPLAEGLRTLAFKPELLGAADAASYAPYEARAVAARFAEIFDRLAGQQPG
jgi:hypothetical protein